MAIRIVVYTHRRFRQIRYPLFIYLLQFMKGEIYLQYYLFTFLFLPPFSMCIPMRKQRWRKAISSSSGFFPHPL